MNRISHKARLFGSLLVLFLCLVGFMQQAAAQCVPAANPDLNNDGIVSLADLYIVTNNFGVPGADETADTNCDGNVDTTDVLFVRSAMGQTFPVGPVVVDIPIDSNPTEFLTDTETTVRFQARILPDLDADPSSAFLYEVDDHLNPQGPALCNLLDNGDLANGDDIAGDSVFSCFVTFLEEASTEIKVAVHILSTGAPASSSLAKLQVVEPLTDQEVQIVLMTQSEAQDIWEIKKTELGDTFGARVAAAEAIALLLGVADAGVSDDEFTIWIKYESGVNGGLMLNPPGTKGDAPVPIGVRASMAPDMPMEFVGPPTSFSSTINQSPEQLPQEQTVSLFALNAATDPTPVGNTSVVVWDPYSDQFPTEGAAS